MNNPWLALSTYEEKDKDKFKGREQDIKNMLKMLQQNEYVICYAASGDGKSSLINAGVCPEMRKIGYYPIKIVFSSDEYEGINIPMKEDNKIDFDACILKKIEESTNQIDFEVDDQFSSLPSSLSSYLWWKLRTQTIQMAYGEFDYIPVLIFDQFEEILRAKWKGEFFAWLEELTSDECPDIIYQAVSDHEMLPSLKKYKVIFSMRYEYVGELDYWCSQRHFIPQMMRGRYFLKPFTRKQALEIITDQELPQNLEEKFCQEATNILENINRDSTKPLGYDEVPAVVLSLVCHILFEKWSFDLDFLIDNTGINSVIYEYYMEEIRSIGIPDEERRHIENTLISPEGNRLRIHISDSRLKSIGFNSYLDKSTKKNLLSAHIVKMNDEYVEFTHDRLAESILINRKEEDKKINKISTYSKIRFGVFFLIFGALLFSCFYFAQKFKSTSVVEDSSQEHQVENRDSIPSLNIVINDINDDLGKYDWDNATSVELASNIHACPRKNVYCYGNVIVLNRYFGYAKNAEKIVLYPHFNHSFYLYLNKDVKDIYIFHPDDLGAIKLSNPYTIVHVPYGSTKTCISNDAFKNVHFVEMSLLETLYEKLKHEVSIQHFHPIGMDDISINLFMVGIVMFLIIIFFIIKTSKANMSSRNTVLLILMYVCMIAISTFLYLELYWLEILKTIGLEGFNISYPILFVFLVELLRYRLDRKYSLYTDKAKVCIVYYSNEGKQIAQKLRNDLINHTNFIDSDILLNMTILHHGHFNEDVFLKNIVATKKVIAIITDSDSNYNDNNRYFTLLGKCKYFLPVIISKSNAISQYVQQMLLEYKNKTYPAVCSDKNYNIDFITQIHKSLLLSPFFEKKLNRWICLLSLIAGIPCIIFGKDYFLFYIGFFYFIGFFRCASFYNTRLHDHINYKQLIIWNVFLIMLGCLGGYLFNDNDGAGIIIFILLFGNQLFSNIVWFAIYMLSKRYKLWRYKKRKKFKITSES